MRLDASWRALSSLPVVSSKFTPPAPIDPTDCALSRETVQPSPPPPQLICPTGAVPIFLSSPLRKNILVFRRPKSLVYPLLFRPTGGAYRDRHGRGAGCGGRGRRFDEGVGLWTAKSRGPDASTLAFKFAEATLQATVTIKPDHRGEREGNR